MLLEFGAKNFFSFKEGFEISLRLNKNCPKNISNGKDYANVACIKGSNASGKTNVLKALTFLKYFCAHSFDLKPEDKIGLETFFDNTNPTVFYSVFKIDKTEYRYEVELNKNKVLSEVLYKKKDRYTKVIERTNDKFSKITSNYSELKIIKLRSNASFISISNQYEIKPLKKIYNFFNSIVSNVNMWGMLALIGGNFDEITKLYHLNPDIFDFVKNVIKNCDQGIENIKILSREDDKDKIYYPVFYHNIENGKLNKLTISHQSSGTKTLYKLLILYYLVLRDGGILVLDEFDINLHPHILPLLVDFFEKNKSNKKQAQMIFTTHNSSIMDKLSRYRTFFVNKEFNSSYAYRLDEIPGDIIRNDRSIVPVYKTGKIGGVPRI